jgi:endonuclease-8
MPEGHTLHRIATHHNDLFAGREIHADSPQGRFTEGAARLDGRTVRKVEAYGKHLFYDVPGAGFLHVHLGLYGKFMEGPEPAPEPRGAVRLRLQTDEYWVELRGATAVEVITPPERAAILARLGPDPLRRDADPKLFIERAAASRAPVGGLLMDQKFLAGIGNVYRAELLFRARIEPHRPGRDVGAVALGGAGVRAGRIVTTLPADRERRSGKALATDAHYVYRREGLPCRVCHTPIRREDFIGRNLFWCASCQT